MALEFRVITNVLVGGVATETFAVVAGLAPLVTTLLAMVTFNDGPLTSWTASICVAALPTGLPMLSSAWAVNRVVFGPVTLVSLIAAT